MCAAEESSCAKHASQFACFPREPPPLTAADVCRENVDVSAGESAAAVSGSAARWHAWLHASGALQAGCLRPFEIERREIDQVEVAAEGGEMPFTEGPNTTMTTEQIVSEHRTELHVRQIGFAGEQAKGVGSNQRKRLGAQVDIRFETDPTTLAATAVCSSAHARCATRAVRPRQLADRQRAGVAAVWQRTNARLLVGLSIARSACVAIAACSRGECARHKACHVRCTDRENRIRPAGAGGGIAIVRSISCAALDKPSRGR